jgi:ABC-type multidrug transport system fused ATPase/permease subunit
MDAPEAPPTLSQMYRTIWSATARQQPLLIFLSLAVAALAAVPLKFQQLAINSMVESSDVAKLAWLCAGYFGAVMLGIFLKFALNYKRSVLGEQAVHMIRDRLYANHVKNAGSEESPKRGTLVTMLTSEAEAVGSFAGIALSAPLMLLGTLISVLGFIVVSQPWLGIMAVIVILPQAAIVTAIQGRINGKVKERVQALRDASDRILESDLETIDARIVEDFGVIFMVRRSIFFLKQAIKLALRSLSAIGTVGFLLLGGWLVIEGRTDVGTVVASLTGLTRIEGPWRELIGFFRTASSVRVQFGMLSKAIVPVPSG